MSKSIYVEANTILNGRIADGEVKSFRVTGTTYYKITNALNQAQKQEKLLELYKELTLILNDLIIKDLSDLALSGGYYKQKILKIKNEIKELEDNE